MKKSRSRHIGAVSLVLITVACLPAMAVQLAPISTRVDALLQQMTLEEKVAQLLQPWETKTAEQVFEQFNVTGLGAWYLSMTDLTSEEPLNGSIAVTFIEETLHSGAPGGTIFPMPINFGSTWNASASYLAAKIIAREARALGSDRGFSPVINIFSDPRYGRLQEGYSEDPTLTKIMGAAHLLGLQGDAVGGPDSYLTNFTHALVGTVKHYAAYGMSAGGIDGSPADLSQQKLREIYLEPWRYLADGRGLRSVMAAQNMVNGRPMHSNKRLLTTILREEWGVTNALVESDGGDCIGALFYGFHATDSIEGAAVLAVEAGMDMDLGGTTFAQLVTAVQTNKTSMASIDRAARNVLTSKFAAGLFESPYTDPTRVQALDSAEGRALALDVAEQGCVLVQNTNAALPMDFSKVRQIALIGPLINDSDSQCGGYTNPGARVVTVQEALTSMVHKQNTDMHTQTSVKAAPGCSADNNAHNDEIPAAAALAAESDAVILVLGDTSTSCGEMYDRSSLDLPGGQLSLLQAVVAAAKPKKIPVVVVLINGRSATFGRGNTVLADVDALLVAWRPGEEGGNAIVNLLSGITIPSGKAWPRGVGGVGGPGQPYLYPYQGNHMGETYTAGDGPSTPLFAFGVGYTYTQFVLENLSILPPKSSYKPDESIQLSLTASNQGTRSGPTVVQIYFRDPVAVPIRIASIQLLAFTKVFVPAGGSVKVTIAVKISSLAYWNDGLNDDGISEGFVVDPGTFELYAGTNGFTSWSAPGGLKTTLTVAP